MLMSRNSVYHALFFFFSSRRRHTRSKRDWSSDVCSSDLRMLGSGHRPGEQRIGIPRVDGQIRASGVRVHEQDPGPGLAAVRRAVHAALLLGRSEERRVGKEGRGGWGAGAGRKREWESELG